MRVLNTMELQSITGGMMSPNLLPGPGGGTGDTIWTDYGDGWFGNMYSISDTGGGGGGEYIPIGTIDGSTYGGMYGYKTGMGGTNQIGIYAENGDNLITMTEDGAGGYQGSYAHAGNPTISVTGSTDADNGHPEVAINFRFSW